MEWTNAVKDMLARIQKMTTGGDVLRTAIRNEVQDLQLLRVKLFCEAAEAARQEAVAKGTTNGKGPRRA
jgi:hypothetical protein